MSKRLIKPNDVSLVEWVAKNSVVMDCGWETPCRVWQGSLRPDGYGVMYVGRKQYRTHVVTFGEVPEGMVRDHLCRNRACNEPSHIRAVTIADNVLQNSRSVTAAHAAKTHCKNGHPFDEENTFHRPDGGRDCRACMAARYRKKNERRKHGSHLLSAS